MKKSRISVTVSKDLAGVLAAYEKAGIDPNAVLVAELRKFAKKTIRAGREKKIASGGCTIGSKKDVR